MCIKLYYRFILVEMTINTNEITKYTHFIIIFGGKKLYI